MDLIQFLRKNAKTIVVVLVLVASVILLIGSFERKSDALSGIVTAVGYLAQSVFRGAG